MGFYRLAGGRGANNDVLDNGVDPKLVHRTFLDLGRDICPEGDLLVIGRQRGEPRAQGSRGGEAELSKPLREGF